jgi:predicted secreted protein
MGISDIGKEEMPVMLKKNFFAAAVLAFWGAALWAGDTASYVDLGFSPDGGVYMFAQYGVAANTLKPWADLCVVDVPQNNFVSGGRISYSSNNPINAGNDGVGAFYRLISQNSALADRYGVDYLRQGRPLYIALDPGEGNPRGERIEFRDFERGFSYQAQLVPAVEGSGPNLKSSFHIVLDRVGPAGDRRTFSVGSPGVKRSQIAAYRIKKVIASPLDNSVIFVIETRKPVVNGFDIRYMVETLQPQR